MYKLVSLVISISLRIKMRYFEHLTRVFKFFNSIKLFLEVKTCTPKKVLKARRTWSQSQYFVLFLVEYPFQYNLCTMSFYAVKKMLFLAVSEVDFHVFIAFNVKEEVIYQELNEKILFLAKVIVFLHCAFEN